MLHHFSAYKAYIYLTDFLFFFDVAFALLTPRVRGGRASVFQRF
jgi:hypothetical protein